MCLIGGILKIVKKALQFFLIVVTKVNNLTLYQLQGL